MQKQKHPKSKGITLIQKDKVQKEIRKRINFHWKG
jgi:hypothetical protein